MTPKELFERYLYAGMTRDADLQAGMFAPDGVLEFPLTPDGGRYPRRLDGRDAIHAWLTDLHARPAAAGAAVDVANSRYVLHPAPDGDSFVAELDAAFTDGRTMSLVHIYRLRDGKIALLRDYFRLDSDTV